jgi:hypothetical protein
MIGKKFGKEKNQTLSALIVPKSKTFLNSKLPASNSKDFPVKLSSCSFTLGKTFRMLSPFSLRKQMRTLRGSKIAVSCGIVKFACGKLFGEMAIVPPRRDLQPIFVPSSEAFFFVLKCEV